MYTFASSNKLILRDSLFEVFNIDTVKHLIVCDSSKYTTVLVEMHLYKI